MNKYYIKKVIAFTLVLFLVFAIFEGGILNPVEAAAFPVKIEAEKGSVTKGALIGKRFGGHTGTGYVKFPSGKISSKVSVTVVSPETSNYDVSLRFSNGNKVAKQLMLYFNDKYFKTISFAPTGSFSVWKTLVCTLRFKKGKNIIGLISKDKTSANLDYLNCVPVMTYNVSMNFETKYQTIAGFGGFGGNDASNTFSTQKFIDDCYDDLGATIYRGHVEQDFQSYNDGSDVNTINPSTFNTQGRFKVWLDYFKAIKAKGPCQIFLTSWSPPAWMKSNNNLNNGGTLKPEFYQHFAKYCAAYVKYMQEGGVDIYAFSIQNEPAFEEPYPSCVFTFSEYAKVIKIVADRFKKEGLNVLMLGPEDVGESGRISNYIFGMDQEGTIGSLGIFAVHGYGDDGVNPGSTAAQWDSTYALARDFNKPLWMTETSGYLNDWESCLTMAQNMQEALTNGRINAWVWWRLSDNMQSRNEMEGLMKNMVPTPKYYVSKNFYRYVRPGSVRYACSSGYSDLVVTAFKNPESKKLTLVLVNEASVSRTITLGAINGGKTPAQFNSYRTSATENCVDAGLVNSSGVVIPAKSVTTLQANY